MRKPVLDEPRSGTTIALSMLGLSSKSERTYAFFAATGITDGELLRGVHYTGSGATTQSIVMRSRTGTIRRIDTTHGLAKLKGYRAYPYD